jgi:hypothetical protein
LPDTKTLRGLIRNEFDKLPLWVGLTVPGVSITAAPLVKLIPARFVMAIAEEFAPPCGVIPVTTGASRAATNGVIARIRQKIIRYERISFPHAADIIPPIPS